MNCNKNVFYLSQGFTFPPEAGYPLDTSKERFYLMETHYNNPNIPTDLETLHMGPIADNSGLKLHYTQALRKHDAGVLSIGMYIPKFSIPYTIHYYPSWRTNCLCVSNDLGEIWVVVVLILLLDVVAVIVVILFAENIMPKVKCHLDNFFSILHNLYLMDFLSI